ncbi:RNA polymerase sigma-70 factor [Mucilaginibacter ginsenosidivorax]|uniref:RNA polymerase sigma-70 factor n=1 Tax=Mucilaginibacter ginsenosidivorax TaxID=862126 RepID=A0A5B8W474_9SPHI|nr:RNA polymerase sigma-70 factor [Mucilaginibacter ginsenosidivorax]QEC78870.1 RNA polymerase sigma-70 factor [Mucilaginibacter ginsenosidivorax]
MPADDRNLSLERELLLKIALKDEQAFTVIYERYVKKIYTFSFRLLNSKQLAEEVVQECFLKIWLLGDSLNSILNIEAYLVTLSRNKSLDVLRLQQREMKSDLQEGKNWIEGHNDTEEAILLNDTRNLLQTAIDQLPPQQKRVYQLCQQEGLKYEEAAKKLNLSPLTVKKHMQLALRFVRTYVATNSKIAIALILLKIR